MTLKIMTVRADELQEGDRLHADSSLRMPEMTVGQVTKIGSQFFLNDEKWHDAVLMEPDGITGYGTFRVDQEFVVEREVEDELTKPE